MEAAEIRRLLPHRYPLLLVDRVLEVARGEWIVAIKAVSCGEPWYAGEVEDGTGQLAYPEVLLVESWAQSAALLALLSHTRPEVLRDQYVVLGAVSDVEFRRPVLPGDVVENRVRISRSSDTAAVFEGEGRVAGEVAFTVGRVVMAFRPAAVLRRS